MPAQGCGLSPNISIFNFAFYVGSILFPKSKSRVLLMTYKLEIDDRARSDFLMNLCSYSTGITVSRTGTVSFLHHPLYYKPIYIFFPVVHISISPATSGWSSIKWCCYSECGLLLLLLLRSATSFSLIKAKMAASRGSARNPRPPCGSDGSIPVLLGREIERVVNASQRQR